MQPKTVARKDVEQKTSSWRVGLFAPIVAMLAMIAMVLPASASVDLNGTIGPLLDSVVALIPSIINLIVAAVPAIIVLAIVGFIVGFLDKILEAIRMK